MIIRIVLLLCLGVVAFLMLRTTSSTHLAARRMATVLFLLLGAGAVLFPSAVTWVASLLGVGRGTDLLLYLLVPVFLCVSISMYRRIQELEDRLVTLARRVAIAETSATQSVHGADASSETSPKESLQRG
jgi:hypothetical protein